MKKIIKNIFSTPLKSPWVFRSIESILGKMFGGFILCWHNLPAHTLKSHIECLYPLKPMPLDELIKRHNDGKTTKDYFALTIDDGIASTVNDISSFCTKMDWPITFYIPTNYLSGKMLPYQKIEFIDQYLPLGDYSVPNISKKNHNKLINKKKLIQSLTSLLYIEHFTVIDKILDHFIEKISINNKKELLHSEYPKSITWQEIEKLSKNSIISFQSHSVTHTALRSLNDSEIEDEMVRSKNILEEHTGKKVNSFSYPYGSEKSIGKRAPKIASKHYNSAVTLIRGRLRKNNPFYLPRIDLYQDDFLSLVRLKVILS